MFSTLFPCYSAWQQPTSPKESPQTAGNRSSGRARLDSSINKPASLIHDQEACRFTDAPLRWITEYLSPPHVPEPYRTAPEPPLLQDSIPTVQQLASGLDGLDSTGPSCSPYGYTSRSPKLTSFGIPFGCSCAMTWAAGPSS